MIKSQVALNQFKAIGSRDPKRALSYPAVRSVRMRVRGVGAGPVSVDLPRVTTTETAASQPPGRRPGGGTKENFDLSTFYSIDGALADSDNNLIPDRVDVVLSAEPDGGNAAVDLAARLGLESTGVAVPIAKPAKTIASPDGEPILVLIGTSHPLIERLVDDHKWERPPLAPGDGLIQIVRKAFGEKSAVIVTGGDAAGVDRAVLQLAEKFPHIWARGKDRTTLEDVEEDVRKFVAGRSPSGQAAVSLYKLDKLAARLQGKDLASAHVRIFVERAADGLADVARKQATDTIKAGSIAVDVQSLDVQKGRTLVNDEFDIPSEVDEFWTKFRKTVLPAVRKRQPAVVEARLSEPPQVRRYFRGINRAWMFWGPRTPREAMRHLSSV